MNEFRVSVIIPVYNAENYVEQAVESAIHLKEVGEVILVEDGSPDNTLEICYKLASKYSNVLLFQHENAKNKGAGASRNLGIKHASYDFIAFLDADDWYLPHRFRIDKDVFTLYPDAQGVYGATGFYYQNSSKLDLKNLTTLKRGIAPDHLIFRLLDGDAGHFTTDAITLKKELLHRIGYFDEELKLHQDTHLWFRCAVQGRLYSGEIGNAVAVRRVHDHNRISQKNSESRRLFYNKLLFSLLEVEGVNQKVIRFAFVNYVTRNRTSLFHKCWSAIKLIFKRPQLILHLI